MTCCSLHNLLLFHNGYDMNWNDSQYEAYINSQTHMNPSSYSSFAISQLNRHISGNIGNPHHVLIQGHLRSTMLMDIDMYPICHCQLSESVL